MAPRTVLLEARAHAAVVANGQQLYVIGGFGPGGRATNTVFRLDGPTQQWRRDDRSLPDLRTSGAAAFDGTRIVFAGGNLDEEPMRDVWALDEQSWKSIGMLQTGRDLAAAGSGNVWFIGGGSGMSGAAYRQVDVAHGAHVDPFTPLNEGVRRPAAVSIGSGFCAIGGHLQGLARSGASGRVQCQGIHGSVPSMPPRVDSGATVLDDTIYVVGGQDPTHLRNDDRTGATCTAHGDTSSRFIPERPTHLRRGQSSEAPDRRPHHFEQNHRRVETV